MFDNDFSIDPLYIVNLFFCIPLSLLHQDGTTALFKAALKGHNSVLEELLKFSPSLGLLKVDDAAV